MTHTYTRERLEGWVSDFCGGDALDGRSAAVAAAAPSLLTAWLVAACDRRDVEPEDLGVDDLRGALLEHVARLDMSPEVHAAVPDMARGLLEQLEQDGRLGDGRELGQFLAASAEAYGRAVRGETETLRRPGSKVGRNDPCPCGSGRKFKRCCMSA